jgi:hypothetical protein
VLILRDVLGFSARGGRRAGHHGGVCGQRAAARTSQLSSGCPLAASRRRCVRSPTSA